MTEKHKHAQQGQALILIAVGMIALIGFAALAVDGGNAFSTRRHAQTAADNGALAAALVMAQTNFENYGISEALNVAASNGFVPSDTTSVIVTSPPGSDCDGNPSPFAGSTEYIQVIINTLVDAYFAPVVGIDALPVCASAVAHAFPAEPGPPFYGAAVAATSCTASPGINAAGSSTTAILGGGVFSNSSDGSSIEIQQNDPDSLQTPTDAGITAVGDCPNIPDDYPSAVNCGQSHLQIPCPLPDYMYPTYTCDFVWDAFPPFNDTTLAAGVHCIDNGIHINAQQVLIGDGVTLVMRSGDLIFNGDADEIFLIAPSSGSTENLVLYVPPENAATLFLNGSSQMTLLGSIFAPTSTLNITGDFAGATLFGQWVGDTVDFSGHSNLTINFDPYAVFFLDLPPSIELAN
jgi:hypothetical protein